jgi:predicted ABC-type sugar transport system permease subunit
MNTSLFHLRVAALVVALAFFAIAYVSYFRSGKGPTYYVPYFIALALSLVTIFWFMLDKIFPK